MKRLLPLFALPFLLVACTRENNNGTGDCSKAICTLEFRYIQTSVMYKNGDTVILDKYYTINTNTGDTIQDNNAGLYPEGSYTVLTDNYTNKMFNKTYNFRFIGILNNVIVVDEPFAISADCCHISKVSGNQSIVID
ncbi:MAG: hypothetical protein KDC07_09945 [Chitinophagaceae bacterium]|nr:hypothetical protein [Chitinophagaceae bacterium]MCB9046151.1 hypothetical protein [Chitinophagales bacterium]